MSKILVFGNYALQVGNRIVGAQVITPPAVYDLTVVQTPNGHLEAYPLSGYSGDKFGLTATPSAHYHLNTYSITGAVLTGNSGTFTSSDVTVQANFAEDPKYTATLQTNGYGSIAANKTTGYQGDTVTLSNTPSADCTFASYAITGATLTGNQFNFGSQNVTAKANFNRNSHTVTVQNDGHGTVTASPTTGYSGTQVTLSTTPASNYEFSGYTITGATLTGNKFNIGTSNVTAKAWFKQSDPYMASAVKIGNLYWMSADIHIVPTAMSNYTSHYTQTASMTKNGISFGKVTWYDGSAVAHLSGNLQSKYGVPAGWRIPTEADWEALLALYPNNGMLADTSTWTSTATWGSTNRNSSKLSLRAVGYYEGSIPPIQSTTGVSYWASTSPWSDAVRKYQFMANETRPQTGTDGMTWPSNPIRLVKNA